MAGSQAGLIKHEQDHDAKATSYQTIEFEHFHAVPTYVKKEDAQLLKHPIPAGKSSSKVEIHHGGKHDHGYAIASLESDAHLWGGHGGGDGHEQEAIKGTS